MKTAETIAANLGDIGTERNRNGALDDPSPPRACGSMGKDIVLGEPREIQARAGREEAERGFCKVAASFAVEHEVELLLDGVKVEDIGGRIGELLLGELGRTPVRALL